MSRIWTVKIDPKFLKQKPKTSKTSVGHVKVPRHLVKALQEAGINLSAVCQDAVDQALVSKTVPQEPNETVDVLFRHDASRLKALKAKGVRLTDVVLERFEALVLELKKSRR